MEVIKFLWGNDATHEFAAFEVFSGTNPHRRNVVLATQQLKPSGAPQKRGKEHTRACLQPLARSAFHSPRT